MNHPTTEQIEARQLSIVVRERDAAKQGLKQIATRLGLHHRATVEQIIIEINALDERLQTSEEMRGAAETRTLARAVRRG